jgi:ParG
MKTLQFKPTPASAEDWVKGSGVIDRESPVEVPPAVKMKRFTIDVPEDLHRRIKVACADRGVTICDVLRETLERDFP